MASSNVVINVRSNLLQVAEDLRKIAGASKSAMTSLNPFVKKTDEAITGATRNSLNGLQRLQNLSSSIAKKMGDSFKAMFSAVGISQGLKMGQIFGQSVKEAFQLSDQIRKLSSIFGMAETRFVGFQAKLVKGLGEIGLSSESATNSLKGLAETQVRGEEALVEYSKLAGQLASLSGQAGQEGEIAKGIANVITERGGAPGDIKQASAVAEDVRKTISATGLKPTEILDGMRKLFANMNVDFKKTLSTSGLMQLAVIQKTAGEGSTEFLQQYLAKSTIERKVPGARGLEGIFTEKGLDIPKFRKAMKGIFATIPEDMQLAAQTLGTDESTAKGLIQLYKSLDRVDDAQKKVQADNKTLTQVYYQSMGALEAFTASLNKFKASLSEEVSTATNWITDALKKGFQSGLSDITKSFLPENLQKKVQEAEKSLPDALGKNFGSTVTTVGAAVGSTMLFGGGMAGLASMLKGKASGLVEKKAAETLLGEKAQPVYVVNADEIGSKSGIASGMGAASGMLGFFGKALGVVGAGVAAYELAPKANELIKEYQPTMFNKSDEIIDNLLQKLSNFVWSPKVEPIQLKVLDSYGKQIGSTSTQPSLNQTPTNKTQGLFSTGY